MNSYIFILNYCYKNKRVFYSPKHIFPLANLGKIFILNIQ